MTGERPWWLADCEARNRTFPTFEIPSRALREDLRPGDAAKLCFEFDQDPDGCAGERMWVNVTKVIGRGATVKYEGELENSPAAIEGLKRGATITFAPEHICEVD